MKKYARRLKQRRERLLQHYDAEDLHQLRVTLRRMRSLLKQVPGKKARALRRDLGELADATNAARDWDTLVMAAGETLPAGQFSQLAPWMEWLRGAARGRVTGMLQSEHWPVALKRWKYFQARLDRESTGGGGAPAPDIPSALRKLAVAQRKALARDDEKRWHRLRIAIKELRYRLDETPKKARSEEVARALSTCRALQDDLGAWHDTVVHIRLLDELSGWVDPASHPEAAEALEALRGDIARQGRQRLEHVRASLVRPEVRRALSLDPASGS